MNFGDSSLLALFAFWFIVYWVIGGVIFALISLTQVMRIRNGRFGCLFTILSAGFAYGAAWMGLAAAKTASPTCFARLTQWDAILQAFVRCGGKSIGSAALLWGGLLLACGLVIMVISRTSSPKR